MELLTFGEDFICLSICLFHLTACHSVLTKAEQRYLHSHRFALCCTRRALALASRTSLGSISLGVDGCRERTAQRSQCFSLSAWTATQSDATTFLYCRASNQSTLLIGFLLNAQQGSVWPLHTGAFVGVTHEVWSIGDLEPGAQGYSTLCDWGTRAGHCSTKKLKLQSKEGDNERY